MGLDDGRCREGGDGRGREREREHERGGGRGRGQGEESTTGVQVGKWTSKRPAVEKPPA